MSAKVVSVDLLEFLMTSPNLFHALPMSQKQEIVSKRPTPHNLDIVSYDEGGVVKFDSEWYSTYDWLTGSLQRKKLYCFICLVIGQCINVADLFASLKNFHKKAHAHEVSKSHIQNMEKFVRILKYNHKQNLIEEVFVNDVFKIRKKILKKFVRFLALTNKTRHLYMTPSASNNLQESLDFLASNDISFPTDWGGHLQSMTSKEAVNELFDFLHEAVKDHIRKEMTNCDFVSIQVDDLSEYTCKPTFSIIFRYLINNKIEERFAGIFEIPEDQLPEGFCETVLNFVRDWGVESKLVGVSNDSPSTKLENIMFQDRNILTLHSANYNLNLVLLKVAFEQSGVRDFAGSVATISTFFSDPKREMRLSAEGYPVPKEFTEPGATLETFIWIIKTKFDQLNRAINYILESQNWDLETTCLAKFVSEILQSDLFVFLLCLFSKIFIISDHISCVIRLVSFKDLKMCTDEIQQFIANMKDIQSSSSLRKIHGESLKMREWSTPPKQSALYKLSDDILRLMQDELGTRFEDYFKLESFQLLDEQRFDSFRKSFPYSIFMELTSLYPVFDPERLETELSVIYEDESKHLPARDLLTLIVENGLTSVYPQTVKLIALFLTLPVYVSEENAEKRTYEKVKIFAKSYNTLELFSTQGILLIENDLLTKLLNDEAFMDEFINSYCQRSKFFTA